MMPNDARCPGLRRIGTIGGKSAVWSTGATAAQSSSAFCRVAATSATRTPRDRVLSTTIRAPSRAIDFRLASYIYRVL
jgi:hypothetical protein